MSPVLKGILPVYTTLETWQLIFRTEMLPIATQGTCIQNEPSSHSPRQGFPAGFQLLLTATVTQHEKKRWKVDINPSLKGRMGKQSMLITVPMGEGVSIPKPNPSVPLCSERRSAVFFSPLDKIKSMKLDKIRMQKKISGGNAGLIFKPSTEEAKSGTFFECSEAKEELFFHSRNIPEAS